MAKLLQRLNVLAICLLSGAIAALLVHQVRPGMRVLAQAGAPDDEWTPKTLEVYPAHAGDPVKLVRITKDDKELVPGTYTIPVLLTDDFDNLFDDWLRDVSVVVRSQASKKIVCVGISVVLPARDTRVECFSITGDRTAPNAWCDAHPHWCDGGCPTLLQRTLQWGRIPPSVEAGLKLRQRADNFCCPPVLPVGAPPQGKEWPGLAPGQDASLSLAVRVEGLIAVFDPRRPFSLTTTRIAINEGIEEARDTEPCGTTRQYSKTGCAFAEVSKFNVGVDVVYFEDGTIWGNYGYGYALPNPDGIFTRVDARHFPGIAIPAAAPN